MLAFLIIAAMLTAVVLLAATDTRHEQTVRAQRDHAAHIGRGTLDS